ncbi:MAG: hypothetical protein C5B55_02320 [Blastocatellia bacterium]|nr:MAG: hypothetical protein C5B55_02320 [Blastocatellia bacterium]
MLTDRKTQSVIGNWKRAIEPEECLKKKNLTPFPFILDELSPLRPTIKRAFGLTYVYLGERLLCGLRDSAKQRGSNGLWLFTTSEFVDSLGSEFDGLPKHYLWRNGNKAWVILASRLSNFEEYALRACELMLSNDRRIGRVAPGRK